MTQTATATELIRPRTRDSVINALRSGVVPSVGLHHIHVGRESELRAFSEDLRAVADGGGAYRIIVGPVGAGKTETVQMIGGIARDTFNLVTAKLDLDARCRLYATGGEAAEFYRRLTASMAIQSKPEGDAIETILNRFVHRVEEEAGQSGETADDVMSRLLEPLVQLVGGFDLLDVLRAYRRAHIDGNEGTRLAVVRWFRGGFNTKTDAKEALGVRTIPNDANMYSFVKLLGAFCRVAGYGGLVIFVDEAAALCAIANAGARQRNYDMVLSIVNDLLQSNVRGVGIIFAGTPDLIDAKKGLHSNEALKSRIGAAGPSSSRFSDLAAPTLMLSPLSTHDLKALLVKIQRVYAYGDESKCILSGDDITQILQTHFKSLGSELVRRTRDVVKSFVYLLDALQQQPDLHWRDLLAKTATV